MPVIQPITSASSGSAYVPTSRTLTINGVTYDLTTDRSWTVEVIDDLIATAPLSYNSGTNTLSISQANGSTDGYLLASDWLVFSNKQDAITLTTTGNSGAATLVGSTLNIPEYTLAGLGGMANVFTTLGDLVYSNAAGAPVRRSPNITTTKMFLSQTGDGTNSAAPQWSVVTAADVNAVPYTGATGNVNLGEYGITAGYLGLDLTPTGTPTTQGTIFWSADDETLDVILDSAVTMKVGQETFYYVKNQTGSTIPKGTIVMANGTLGSSGRITIEPFIADGTYPSKFMIGVTAEEIINGADGFVTAFGKIRMIDTTPYADGDILYASPSGGFTTTIPTAPNNIVTVAIVIKGGAANGTIFVRPTFGSNINEDEGILITSPSNNQLLKYNSTSGLWENFTPTFVDQSRTLTINGTAYDLSADRTWTIPTHDAVTIGTANGLSLSGQVLSLGLASSSTNGALSSTDWTTFNSKQTALNGTGFVKISGTTISYDNSTYYLASNPSNYITLTSLSAGTGISYNNTTGVISSTITQYTDALARACISETITGIDYNNTTGVFSITSGYGIPTTASQTNWDSAYNNMIVSAAVTGTTTKTLTLTQQDAGTITASWTDDNTDAVTSVFGRTGAVVALSGDYNTSQVTESGNLYYTDARARAAITLTTTGSSGSSTYNSTTGVLNVPTYTAAGLGAVPTSRTLTINDVAFDLSANRSWSVGDFGTW